MAELRRPVKTFEVNYLCDKCEHGMVQRCGETDPTTGATPHRCVICAAEYSFQWVTYPRIDYVGEDEAKGS